MALNYAIDHPDKVKALVLIAAQYKMPKELLKVQNMLFHLMPNSAFNKMGFKKADVISLCGTMAELDFSDSLHKVSCPVLIVCGEKDKANKKTSKELCHYLNNSYFHETFDNVSGYAYRNETSNLTSVIVYFKKPAEAGAMGRRKEIRMIKIENFDDLKKVLENNNIPQTPYPSK